MKQVFGIRMTISSGYGDFGIASIVIIYLGRINSPYYTSVFLSPSSITKKRRRESTNLWSDM